MRRLSPDIILLELSSNDLTKLPAQAVSSELETYCDICTTNLM